MGECKICKKESKFISKSLSLCKDCITSRRDAVKISLDVHAKSRKGFGLPETVPKDPEGLPCGVCGNECKIPNGQMGFCGLVENKDNQIIRRAGTPDRGLCESYYDPHVTNCVAAWVCPAGTGCGYPKFAVKDGPEHGYSNLAVFYGACCYDCLFCQNWHFRHTTKSLSPVISSEELAEKVNEEVTCICYFGGDPAPQLPHVIATSKKALEEKEGDVLRICMETDGNANPILLKKFAKIAFESGGCIKIDLKCINESLSYALSGISNKTTYKNFKSLVKLHKKRPDVPFLHASTLLIPGYVSVDEIRSIANFIANLDVTIPYSLLAFYPTFMMNDLPFTSKKFAMKCYIVAKNTGLQKVRVGNIHLLR